MVVRETTRVAVAFAIYLLLLPLWEWSGASGRYDAVVMGLASWVFLPTQHFPVVTTLDDMDVVHLDFALLFTFSLFLVSTAVPLRRRIRNFGLALLAVGVLHVLTVVLQVKTTSAIELNQQVNLLVLLPWEFKLVERAKYLFYDFGLQAVPFVLVLLTATWNTGWRPPAAVRLRPPAGRLTRGRAVPAALLVALLLVVATLFAWSRWRESHPLHVGAHATLGRLYEQSGRPRDAEEQYRIAIAGGTDDPQVFHDLGVLVGRSGRKREARDLLMRGWRATADPQWQARFDRAIAELNATNP